MFINKILALLFFLSGLSSLVLETVWVRQMVLVFGSTTFAVSTVLTAFMGGLALGSFWAGRIAGRLHEARTAILLYALLEGAVGLFALAMPLLIARLPGVHDGLFGSGQGSYHLFALLRFLLAFSVLVVPTAAMGATLPVLAHVIGHGQDPRQTGRTVGGLYAINMAGAVGGVALAGFILLPGLGLFRTTLVACVLDLLLACAAVGVFWRARLSESRATLPVASVVEGSDGEAGWRPSWRSKAALYSIVISGALAMVNQVAWTRSLSLVIGSSTYAFSLILAVFLLGLTAGTSLYARRQAQQEDQLANLSQIHLLVAIGCAVGLLFMDRLPLVFLIILERVELSAASMFAIQLGLSGLIIFLPTFFMGMVFPAVLALYARGGLGPARAAGSVYAANTLGSILGSFAGGFLLVPLCGLRTTLLAMVLVSLVLSLLFGPLAVGRRARWILPGLSLATMAALLTFSKPWNLELLTSGVFRVSRYQGSALTLGRPPSPEASATRDTEGARPIVRWLERARPLIPAGGIPDTFEEPRSAYGVVLHKEGVTTTVSIARSVDFSLSSHACWLRTALLVNGKPDASLSVLHQAPEAGCHTLLRGTWGSAPLGVSPSGDAETQILSGLLPVLLSPSTRSPRSALVIGWGSGVTVGALLQTPIESVEAVELEAEVVNAARLFEPHNLAPLDHPRLRLIPADGRNVLATAKHAYDVIISEPSNPWISGCGNLFTREFFELVRRRLSPDGVFVQWIQAYEISPENVFSILATLSEVMPSVHVFSPVRADRDLLILSSPRRGLLSWSRARQRMATPAVARLLGLLGIRGPAGLAVRLLAAPDGVRKASQGAPVHTDDNARLEFETPKDLINYRRFSPRRIVEQLGRTLPDPLAAFEGVPTEARIELCEAGVRTGRSSRMSVQPRRRSSSESGDGHDGAWNRCRALDHAARRPLPPLDLEALRALFEGQPGWPRLRALLREGRSSEQTLEAAAALLSPELADDEIFAVFALFGHLAALAGEAFEALTFLLAAHALAPEADRGYAPLPAVLVHQLVAAGAHEHAIRILEMTLDLGR